MAAGCFCASGFKRRACVRALPGTLSGVGAFVYLLRCRDGSLYCGWTNDLALRLTRHNAGTGAAYTRSRRPVCLVWHEDCGERGAALRRECAIKRLARRDKLRLVAGSPAMALSSAPARTRTRRRAP
jgi:putative endonuclease